LAEQCSIAKPRKHGISAAILNHIYGITCICLQKTKILNVLILTEIRNQIHADL